jgi:hypothetical protein
MRAGDGLGIRAMAAARDRAAFVDLPFRFVGAAAV